MDEFQKRREKLKVLSHWPGLLPLAIYEKETSTQVLSPIRLVGRWRWRRTSKAIMRIVPALLRNRITPSLLRLKLEDV